MLQFAYILYSACKYMDLFERGKSFGNAKPGAKLGSITLALNMFRIESEKFHCLIVWFVRKVRSTVL